MGSPLLPDLSATKDHEVAPGLTFRIGYIKPAKLTELRFRLAKLRPAVGEGADDAERLDAIEPVLEVYRDICRWGLRGWNLDEPFPAESEMVRGREVQVAAEAVVEAVEARGWLSGLAIEVLSYNHLDDESKKK